MTLYEKRMQNYEQELANWEKLPKKTIKKAVPGGSTDEEVAVQGKKLIYKPKQPPVPLPEEETNWLLEQILEELIKFNEKKN